MDTKCECLTAKINVMTQELELQTLNRVRLMVSSITSLLNHMLDFKDVPKRTYQMREAGRDMIYFGWAKKGICVAPRPLFHEKVYYEFFNMKVDGSDSVTKYSLCVYKNKVEFFKNYKVEDHFEKVPVSLEVVDGAFLGDNSIFERLTTQKFVKSVLLSSRVVETVSGGVLVSREYSGWISRGQVRLMLSLMQAENSLPITGFDNDFYYMGVHFNKTFPNGARSYNKFERTDSNDLGDTAGFDPITIEGLLACFMDSPFVKYDEKANEFRVLLSEKEKGELYTLHETSKNATVPILQMRWRSRGFECRISEVPGSKGIHMFFKS